MGTEASREIVRLFLDDFPNALERLARANRDDRHRTAHGLKSSSLHMGAVALSRRMAAIEAVLGGSGEGPSKDELDRARSDFEAVAPVLRAYVKG